MLVASTAEWKVKFELLLQFMPKIKALEHIGRSRTLLLGVRGCLNGFTCTCFITNIQIKLLGSCIRIIAKFNYSMPIACQTI
jgi:hypothetical protein